jgi:hypothetical protein
LDRGWQYQTIFGNIRWQNFDEAQTKQQNLVFFPFAALVEG